MTISEFLIQRKVKHTNWYLASFVPGILVLLFKPNASFLLLFASLLINFGAPMTLILGYSNVEAAKDESPERSTT